MLDQNTDRMWFVIGAVIVGAAIIFIANGTLPTLFASVSDTFEESAEKGTEVVHELGVISSLPPHIYSYFGGVKDYDVADDSYILHSDGSRIYRGIYIHHTQVAYDVVNTLRFDLQKIDGDITVIGQHLRISNPEDIHVTMDGAPLDILDTAGNWTAPYPNDTAKHQFVVTFIPRRENIHSNNNMNHVHIQPNRLERDLTFTAKLTNLSLDH